jgi:hypothetical protein
VTRHTHLLAFMSGIALTIQRLARSGGRILPIPVAEQSKARVCDRSLAGVVRSNTAGGMDVCVVCCK